MSGKKLRLAVAVSFAGIECSSCKHKDCDGSKGWSSIEFEGEEIKECPLTLIQDNTRHALQMYSHYSNGYLPVAGGMLDQTAQFMKAMLVIENAINENRKEEDGGN